MPLLPLSADDDLGLPGRDRGPGRLCPEGLGVLTGEISPGMVDQVIELAGCREKRRRLLPARTVVYFVLGLCLFSGADSMGPPGYRSVMRSLTNGLRHLHGMTLPSSSALTRARQRLGSKPLELLFDLRRGALAAAGTPGAFAFGLRLVAWDGTGIDAADTAANAAAFGGVQGGGPQLRLLALIECGTHAVIDAVFDGVARASEQKLARRLLPALGPGMLLLADRNFPGYQLWGLAAGTGADLAWRIKKNLVFPPLTVLPDGSFLSVMPTPEENIRLGQARAAGRIPSGQPEGHLVRIIEYTVWSTTEGGETMSELFCLATTLLDHRRYPALELVTLYHQRWEIESAYFEIKKTMLGRRVLRARTLPGITQEIYALLTVYQALRIAITDTALTTPGTDPDRASFTIALQAAREQVIQAAGVIAGETIDLAGTIGRRILDNLLPDRRLRVSPRAVKRPLSRYAYKSLRIDRRTYKATISIDILTNPPSP